ncbi:MAG: type IX secretion system membrane protein PorP/SprF [Bacteroidota bacterium]
MKRLLFFIFSVSLSANVLAQQEQQYTQFMYNKLAFNPGYAGSKGVPCFTAIYRNQWIGLVGAPETQVFSFNTLTSNKRVGLGLNFVRNTIGISERFTIDGAYAYKIRINKAVLGIGLQASLRYYGLDFSDDRLVANTPLNVDGAIEAGAQNKYLPNFGMGAYLDTEYFYVGISAPRLLKNNLDFDDLGSILSAEVRHLFAMAGVRIPLGEKIQLAPQVLVKYLQEGPLDYDINLNLLLQNKVTLGTTYRHGGSSIDGRAESFDFLFGVQAVDRLFLGFSYDMTLSEIRDHSRGSVEALVQYCIIKNRNKDFINPRYF